MILSHPDATTWHMWCSILILLLLLLLESCLQTCMTYTIAECTVNNS
jgi:hypothetical protein